MFSSSLKYMILRSIVYPLPEGLIIPDFSAKYQLFDRAGEKTADSFIIQTGCRHPISAIGTISSANRRFFHGYSKGGICKQWKHSNSVFRSLPKISDKLINENCPESFRAVFIFIVVQNRRSNFPTRYRFGRIDLLDGHVIINDSLPVIVIYVMHIRGDSLRILVFYIFTV